MPRWCSSPISAAYSICEGASEKLVGCGGRHGAGDAHLALATHLGTRDRGVVFDDVAEQAGRGQRAVDACVGETAALLKMVQHGRHHTARPAGRGRYDPSARSVLFGYGQCVGEDQTARLKALLVARSAHVVGRGAAREVQRTGRTPSWSSPRSTLSRIACQISAR